ncbi:MAG: hypothetical protein Rubg2KO_22590 [Rubricoccaceae bacterium]
MSLPFLPPGPTPLPSPARMAAPFSRLPLALATLLLASSLAACDESIPKPDEIEETYTLWGAFNPSSDQQFVRVVPITDTISLGSRDPLGVEVRSVDLLTGAETSWRDSVVTYPGGATGHVFTSSLRPSFESRHVFRVIPTDGRDEVSALVPIPPLVEPILQTVNLTAAEATYPIFWPGAPQVNNPTLTYHFEDGFCNRDSLQVPFPGTSDPAEFGWQMRLELDEDTEPNEFRISFPTALIRLTVRGEVASEGWRLPLAAADDPELLIQPEVLTNVENGFGFVGAAYTVETSWVPTIDELQRSPFERPNFGEDCTRS